MHAFGDGSFKNIFTTDATFFLVLKKYIYIGVGLNRIGNMIAAHKHIPCSGLTLK